MGRAIDAFERSLRETVNLPPDVVFCSFCSREDFELSCRELLRMERVSAVVVLVTKLLDKSLDEKAQWVLRLLKLALGERRVVELLGAKGWTEEAESKLEYPETRVPVDSPLHGLGDVLDYANEGLLAGAAMEPWKLLLACAQNADADERRKIRESVFHGDSNKAAAVKLQVVDLCDAIRCYRETSPAATDLPLTIAWIENTPDEEFPLTLGSPVTLRDLMTKCLQWFPHSRIGLLDGDYERLRTGLMACENPDDASLPLKWLRDDGSLEGSSDVLLGRVDIFLIDIFLASDIEGAGGVNGLDLQQQIKNLCPGALVVVATKSGDYDNIKLAFDRGTEYYLPKDQFLSFPRLYFGALESLGYLVGRIENSAMRRHLVGLLRRWQARREHLWIGDKCFHMCNHAYEHAADDWKLFNEAVEVLDQYSPSPVPFDDSDIYAFALAIWLHDTGHRGNERIGEACLIRENHGLIAAEFILAAPELLGVAEEVSFLEGAETAVYERHYAERSSGARYDHMLADVDTWSTSDEEAARSCDAALQTLGQEPAHTLPVDVLSRHERLPSARKKGLSVAEKVALAAMYHKSNTPLLDADVNIDTIPSEYMRGPTTPVTCEGILSAAYGTAGEDRTRKLLTLVSLLRFVDGLDIHSTRVGGTTEGNLRKAAVHQDVMYVLRRLTVEAVSIADAYPELAVKVYSPIARVMAGRADEDREREKHRAELKEIERIVGSERSYFSLLEHAGFLLVQDGHFELHGCVDEVRIGWNPNTDRLRVTYEVNRSLRWLKEHFVKEKGDAKNKTILEKLVGVPTQDKRGLPYPLGELAGAGDYLKDWIGLADGIECCLELPGSLSPDEVRSLEEAGYVVEEERLLVHEVSPDKLCASG